MEPIIIILGIILVGVVLYFLFKKRRDPQRTFSELEKKEILKRQNYECPVCGDKDWRLFEAHHKKPWSENGPTNVENGIMLCSKCHTKITKDYSER